MADFCFPKTCPFIVLFLFPHFSIKSAQSLSITVTPCIPVSLSSWFSVPLLITKFDVLTSANKAECFARIFSSNSTLESSGVSLPDFLVRNEPLLSDIHITLFMVSASISKQDGHKTSELDGIAQQRLRNVLGNGSLLFLT